MRKSLPRVTTAKLRENSGRNDSIAYQKPQKHKTHIATARQFISAGDSQNRRQIDSGRSQSGEMEYDGGSSSSNVERQNQRTPLSLVVSDCVKRWFQDALKEAKSGDVSMQVLVGQMYYNAYGVAKDDQKGRIWMTRASRVRSSVWKVSGKRPGYNASDSDSDEPKDDS